MGHKTIIVFTIIIAFVAILVVGSIAVRSLLRDPFVPYDQAREMVLDGEVSGISQAHSKHAWIMTKDGRRYITKQPRLDDLLNVIEQCGEPCSDIDYGTE